MIFWIAYWIILLTAATAAVGAAIFRWAHEELDQHNQEQQQRIEQAELAYLRTRSTRSRIRHRPDL